MPAPITFTASSLPLEQNRSTSSRGHKGVTRSLDGAAGASDSQADAALQKWGVATWATSSSWASRSCSSACVCSTYGQLTSCKEAEGVPEYIIVGVIAAGVMVYLAYALLFPEKF